MSRSPKPLVFLSYRRDDTDAFTGQVAATLRRALPHVDVFLDSASIRSGDDWSERIEAALARATVVVPVIGPTWLTVGREGIRRLDHTDDWVRREIATALTGSSAVVPVLYSPRQQAPTTLPSAGELPVDLRDMLAIQAVDVRAGHVDRDLEPLIQRIREHAPPPTRWPRYLIASAVAVTLLVAGVLSFTRSVRLDPSGRLVPPQAPGSLWQANPAHLVQVRNDGTVHVWRGEAGPAERLEPADHRRSELPALTLATEGCGSALERAALAREAGLRSELAPVCADLDERCAPLWKGGPPALVPLRQLLMETCP